MCRYSKYSLQHVCEVQNPQYLDNRIKCICLIINKSLISTVSDQIQMALVKHMNSIINILSLKINGAETHRLVSCLVLSGCDRLVLTIVRKRCD